MGTVDGNRWWGAAWASPVRAVIALLLLAAAALAAAAPIALPAPWVDVGSGQPSTGVRATGGAFERSTRFEVSAGGRYVVDFKNSSVIGRFEHRLYDGQGRLLAVLRGGIESGEPNPFLLRHGRELTLAPGAYRLVTRVDSPFFLAQPEPYFDELDHYRQAIKPGNALVLLCLGVFCGLGFYYACLALARRRRTEALYAGFIVGNLLYNATALLALREFAGIGAFYLISAPILLSNIAYVAFVAALLDIRRDTAPRLHRIGRALVGLLAGFALLGLLRPHWSLELDRIGVGLFLLWGFVAGVARALRGDRLAPLYLAANVGFLVTGAVAISAESLHGVYTLYIEHIGLAAVTIEVLLLALVLARQFGLLEDDKAQALARAEHSLALASTDALTGLPNRYAFELALAALPADATLTLIDLDGLKYYNDRFGHARGDELLCRFATALSHRLGGGGVLYRHGGDEFALLSAAGAFASVELPLQAALSDLAAQGYEFSGASFGSVRADERADTEALKHLADARMYTNKRERRQQREAGGPATA